MRKLMRCAFQQRLTLTLPSATRCRSIRRPGAVAIQMVPVGGRVFLGREALHAEVEDPPPPHAGRPQRGAKAERVGCRKTCELMLHHPADVRTKTHICAVATMRMPEARIQRFPQRQQPTWIWPSATTEYRDVRDEVRSECRLAHRSTRSPPLGWEDICVASSPLRDAMRNIA